MEVTSNRRILKNTLFLYLRMGITMWISLYVSRVVLLRLGIEDYGVYMVVGGLVTMLGFLNSSMITSTQRYLNFEMGRGSGNIDSLKKIFSNSLGIHVLIIGIVVVLAETVGLWLVENKLVIPSGSRHAANVVYQTSVAIFCLSVIQSPFNAAIIAHENMKYYALICVVESLMRLGVALALGLFDGQRLIAYGWMMLGVQVLITSFFIIVARRRFPECTFSVKYEKGKFKEMTIFAGWNIFGSVAWLVRTQGLGIVLNMFFGPVLNAAKGIADQVGGAVSALNSNFQVALNPQITKSYAAGKLREMELLAYRGLKFSTLLQWIIIMPIMVTVNTLLLIWLKEVPEEAPLFVILVLMDNLATSFFGSPLMTSVTATGRIRNYQIVVSMLLLLVLPASYIALKCGMPAATVFCLNIFFNLLAGIARFLFCRHELGYSIRFYLRYVGIPVITVAICSGALPVGIEFLGVLPAGKYLRFLCLVALSVASGVFSSWWIGFNNEERVKIKSLLKQKLHLHG